MTERFMVFLADDDAVKCEVVPSSAYDQLLRQMTELEVGLWRENAQLKAEIERLRELSGDLMAERNECREERERLRRALSVIAGGFAPAAEIAQEALDDGC